MRIAERARVGWSMPGAAIALVASLVPAITAAPEADPVRISCPGMQIPSDPYQAVLILSTPSMLSCVTEPGAFVMQIRIAATGHVLEAVADGPATPATLCLEQVVAHLQFPRASGELAIRVPIRAVPSWRIAHDSANAIIDNQEIADNMNAITEDAKRFLSRMFAATCVAGDTSYRDLAVAGVFGDTALLTDRGRSVVYRVHAGDCVGFEGATVRRIADTDVDFE
jgi:hypothetical protein